MKRIALLLALLILTACGSSSQPTTGSKAAPSPAATPSAPAPAAKPAAPAPAPAAKPAALPQKIDLVVAGGAQGSTGYVAMAALAKVVQDKVPGVTATVRATSGSSENARLVGEGGAQFGFASSEVMWAAIKGAKPFEKVMPIRALMSGHETVLGLITLEKTGIKTFADIKGRRVSPGAAGSGGAIFFPLYTKEIGLEMGKDFQAPLMSYADSANALKEGVIDAFFPPAKPPAPQLQEMSASRTDVRTVQFDEAVLKKVAADKPFWTIAGLGTGYKAAAGVVNGVNFPIAVIVSEKMDPAVAKAITRAIMESSADLTKISPIAADYNNKRWAAGVNIPFHKGAAEYYKEANLWQSKPENAKE